MHGGIWLEHFANDANGELPERWDEDEPGATAKYREQRRWKEQLHASLGTRFTLTEFGDIQRCMRERTSFPDLLLQRIADQGKDGVETPSAWDVQGKIQRLKAEEADAQHWRIAYEIDAWIRTRRQQVRTDDGLNMAISRRETAEESRALYRLASPVLERYVQHLEKTKTVDHEGTILKGLQYVRERAVVPPWKVILIDEYQDVNPAQAAFVHALLMPRVPARAAWHERTRAAAAAVQPRLPALGDRAAGRGHVARRGLPHRQAGMDHLDALQHQRHFFGPPRKGPFDHRTVRPRKVALITAWSAPTSRPRSGAGWCEIRNGYAYSPCSPMTATTRLKSCS